MASIPNMHHTATASVDVELPLRHALSVDLELPLGDVAAALSAAVDHGFQPSLSQVAADLSLPRMRWPAGSRSGYHGLSDVNWMRDAHVGLAQATMPAR
ncbi:MAG: hypothetical protein ABIR55_13350 [Burkholderiaceae bacterium]